MFWGKRQFAYADFAPYQDRLSQLLMADAGNYRQYIMVSTDTGKPGISNYYVGVPREALLRFFDGFDPVTEQDLPQEIDTLLLAEGSSDEFTSRFKFRRR